MWEGWGAAPDGREGGEGPQGVGEGAYKGSMQPGEKRLQEKHLDMAALLPMTCEQQKTLKRMIKYL